MSQSRMPALKGPGRPGAVRRRLVTVSRDDLVELGDLDGGPLPLVVRPKLDDLDLVAWGRENRDFLDAQLSERGGILFRGFALHGEDRFETFIRALSDDLLEYTYRSTPRREVSGRIYTSTEYPADQTIPMHNEMSYSTSWPMKIWFHCVRPAAEGGETPIADSRRVYERIPLDVRERFESRGVAYVRNYGEGLDLSWQEVFQTDDRGRVESYCRDAGIEVEWKEGDRLRTRQVCQATAVHPRTGERVWFNQAHLFHVSSLPEDMRESLVASFGEDGLPRNAYYGDGSRFAASDLDAVREAFAETSVAFPWQQDDVLMLDNMLAAHGRRPFGGSRRVVVGMAEPHAATRQDQAGTLG